MPARIDHIQLLVDRLRALVPDDTEEKSYLTDLIYERMAVGNRSKPMGVVVPPESAEQIYGAALRALEYLDQPAELAAMPEGIVGLANLAWENRPALPLLNGEFQQLAVGPWQHLASDIVRQQAQSVCRIDLCTNGILYGQLGTGFVVGIANDRLLIMTNAHVVEEALRVGWPALSTLTLTCDFARESALTGGALLPVDHEYHIHASHDLALLYLQQVHFSNTPPPVLQLAEQVPMNAINLPVGVIGHPALNTQRDGVFPIYYGFGNAFGVKRFSPGLVRTRAMRGWYGRYQSVDAIFHDATTLGGNSGSCIVDLDRGLVVGLHFGGWPMPVPQSVQVADQSYLANLFYENGAVPLWTLAQDVLLSNVNFVA